MLKIATSTIGCKVNQYETEIILRDFKRCGFGVVDSSEKADVYVINTCSVTRNSDRKSRQAIRRAVRDAEGSAVPVAYLPAVSTNRQARQGRQGLKVQNRSPQPSKRYVVVVGCYVQKSPQEVSQIPGVDLVVLNKDKSKLVELVAQRFNLDLSRSNLAFDNSIRQVKHTRALVKVQDGCDNYCSYCVVPYLRGEPASRSKQEIVEEVSRLAESGVREIVLTGINLGKYGEDFSSDIDLLELLTDLVGISGIMRVRLSSIEVDTLDLELIKFISSSSKICHHLHLPLQSGSDRILALMGRKYKVSDYLDVVEKLKRKIPELALTTDVMVGFPGETENDFTDTIGVVEEVGFSKLHVFKFSPREGTRAAAFPNQVPERTKVKRSQELIEVGNRMRQKFLQNFEGKTLEVLVEKEKKGELSGLTRNYIRVIFKGPVTLKGKIVLVKAVSARGEYVYGELLESVPVQCN